MTWIGGHQALQKTRSLLVYYLPDPGFWSVNVEGQDGLHSAQHIYEHHVLIMYLTRRPQGLHRSSTMFH